MWPFDSSRRSEADPRWTEQELALESAPWTPLHGLDEAGEFPSGDYRPETQPGTYLPPAIPQKGWRRFLPRRAQNKSWLWWISRWFASFLLLFIVLVGWLAITAPLNKSLQPIAPPQITLLAADGTPIARNGAVVDEPVLVADLPAHVIEPFLAIEDRRFYEHWGVDPRGVARAVFTGVGGGSTITQQLAKFTFLTPEQTLTRKAREALIAFWLEAWLTKDEILERYLSNAYFGDNMYGIRAASLHYFYRQPENLRPEQAAMLAGLLQAPSRLAPTQNPDLAAARYGLVKNALVAAGYITQAEADAMEVPALDVRTRNDLPTGTYFADWALPEARLLSDNSLCRANADHHARFAPSGSGPPRRRPRAAGRCAGGDGGDAPQWRSGGDDRRARLFRIAVQPRHAGDAPAGVHLQTVRLSRRTAQRLEPGRYDPQHRLHRRHLSPRQLQRQLF